MSLVLNTYTRIFPLPEQDALSVPLVTVFVSPVTQSTYVPFSTPVKVPLPEMQTSA